MFQALGNRLLITRLDDAPLTSSVIEVVRLNESTPSQYALVLSVGAEVDGVVAGDTIITRQYCGTPVSIQLQDDGPREDCFIITGDDALAVVQV